MAEAAQQQAKTAAMPLNAGASKPNIDGPKPDGGYSALVPLASVTLNNSTPFASDHRSDYQTGPRMTVTYNRKERMVLLQLRAEGSVPTMIPVEGVKYMVPAH